MIQLYNNLDSFDSYITRTSASDIQSRFPLYRTQLNILYNTMRSTSYFDKEEEEEEEEEVKERLIF